MISKLRQGNTYLVDAEGVYMEYVCDTIAEVANLPTSKNSDSIDRPRPGSTAVIAEAGMVYVLSNEREWVALIG